MKKKHISTIIIALIFLAGLGFLLYPTVSNLWNRAHQSRAIATYTKQVEKLDDSQNKEMLKAARKYNKSLLKKSDHWKLSKKDKKKYESLLDVSGTGIMGYIEVPKIDCSLPIYHGLPSARLFTDLDQMEEGDVFVLNVLGRKLAYEVDQIKVVLPDEMSDLEIVQGKDLCTLVTCTPYGINTHRLLVRGHRTKYIEETVVRVQKEAEKKETGIWLLASGGAVFLIIIIIVVVKRRRKRRNLQR